MSDKPLKTGSVTATVSIIISSNARTGGSGDVAAISAAVAPARKTYFRSREETEKH